jgi:hypothetical protein
MNPARSFGPDIAVWNLSTWWVYLIGPVVGAVIAVGVAYVLRGPAKVQEQLQRWACHSTRGFECLKSRDSALGSGEPRGASVENKSGKEEIPSPK